jgi:hypothetical protein
MRLQYSLSPSAFRSINDKLMHLLTVCELARLRVGFLSLDARLPYTCLGEGLRQLSIYAALSIYSFTQILWGQVDASMVEGLIGVDIGQRAIFNQRYALEWLEENWNRVRSLASPGFPLELAFSEDTDLCVHALRSVLMEQTGIHWRPCQEEQNMGLPQLDQKHELIALSIWRELGVGIHEFSMWQRASGCVGCITYHPLTTRCQVCGVDAKCHRQGGVWLCADQCRSIDIPLDMMPMTGSNAGWGGEADLV